VRRGLPVRRPLKELPSASLRTDLGWVRASKEGGETPRALGFPSFRWHYFHEGGA
jgi:hypothetical protein